MGQKAFSHILPAVLAAAGTVKPDAPFLQQPSPHNAAPPGPSGPRSSADIPAMYPRRGSTLSRWKCHCPKPVLVTWHRRARVRACGVRSRINCVRLVPSTKSLPFFPFA